MAELYDPATGTFSAASALPEARYGHTATPISNGRVMLTGGTSFSGYLASAVVYHPTLNT